MQVFTVYDLGGRLRALFLDQQEAMRYAASHGWLTEWVEPATVSGPPMWREVLD